MTLTRDFFPTSSGAGAPDPSVARTTPADDSEASVARHDEALLVARAVQRDAAAFAQLYERTVVRVYRHVYYILRDTREAEDITAQAYLQAWEAIDRYQQRGSPFSAWVTRIGHNLALSRLRAHREVRALDERHADDKASGDPELALQQASDEMLVRRALLQLRGEQRHVLMLRFVEELPYPDVAELLGKTVPAVRVIQHRALANLRRIMET